MRVHGGTAVVKLLASSLICLQGSSLWAQSTASSNSQSYSAYQLAPIVTGNGGIGNGGNAVSGLRAGSVQPVAHNQPLVGSEGYSPVGALPQVGIPLQPLIPLSKQPQSDLTLSPMLPEDAGNLPTVPREAWGPGVALQPISRTNDLPTVPRTAVASLPFAVLPMTKYDNAGASTEKRAKLTASMMTGPMSDPLMTFAKLDNPQVPPGPLAAPVRNHEDYLPWSSATYTWFSPVFSHRPLYFEQPNLERYGMGTHYYLQPAASSAHFFSSVALMPYKVLTQHPNEHVYTLGFGRPGNCEPFQGRTWLGQSYPGEACKVLDPYSGY